MAQQPGVGNGPRRLRPGRCAPTAMTADRQLKVRTVPARDPRSLLGELRDPRPLAWIRQNEGLAGWGEAATITVPAGPGRFAVAERLLRELFDTAETEDPVGLPGCGLVAFGSFTFDPARDGSVLVVPRTVAGRRGGAGWVTSITAAGQGKLAGDDCSFGPTAGSGCEDAGLTAAQ
jgi:hypothetical protein